ncbi:hypothetical protein ANCDUO_00795 [Ancylostoma duodenale]|uniref:Laminin N-terminal domain-containing protein n=1 Tax=Ancylostoma duodenale TaxID=51022 RepID=A0A0C2E0N4_9BILA|nr:hypothetical protein ANCDUO_00795 [Ancylostoma duodenale]
MLLRVLLSAALVAVAVTQVLTPSLLTISHRKPIRASSTCGEHNGQPINEVYCSLTGQCTNRSIIRGYIVEMSHDYSRFYSIFTAELLLVSGGHN